MLRLCSDGRGRSGVALSDCSLAVTLCLPVTRTFFVLVRRKGAQQMAFPGYCRVFLIPRGTRAPRFVAVL